MKSWDCTASDLSACIRIIYLNAVYGRRAGRFPPPYSCFILVCFAVKPTPHCQELHLVPVCISPRNNLENMWKISSFQSQEWCDILGGINVNVCRQICTEVVLRCYLCRLRSERLKKKQNWQHKQTTAENLSPLTMPFFSLLIPFFISCWFWTAAPVCCLVWCVWQQAACRRERLLAVLSLTAVLVVHKLLSCVPHCATPSGAQTTGGDALVGILLTSKQSTGHITAQ